MHVGMLGGVAAQVARAPAHGEAQRGAAPSQAEPIVSCSSRSFQDRRPTLQARRHHDPTRHD